MVELITRLDTQLARLSPGYVLERCKTKYGTLRYYARPEDSEDIDTQMTFNEIIRDTEAESARICEDCGEPGQQVTLHGRRRVLVGLTTPAAKAGLAKVGVIG